MKKNFTLIELLVVIAIIAILTSLLLPALQSAKKVATRILCVGNMKTHGTAIGLYAHDFNDFFPIYNFGGSDIGNIKKGNRQNGKWAFDTVGANNNGVGFGRFDSGRGGMPLRKLAWYYLNKDGSSFLCPGSSRNHKGSFSLQQTPSYMIQAKGNNNPIFVNSAWDSTAGAVHDPRIALRLRDIYRKGGGNLAMMQCGSKHSSLGIYFQTTSGYLNLLMGLGASMPEIKHGNSLNTLRPDFSAGNIPLASLHSEQSAWMPSDWSSR